MGRVEQRVADQPERDERGRQLRALHDAAPVDGVGEHAAEEPQADDRHELGEAEQPDGQRGVRERVDLEGQRDDGEERAGVRHELARDQQPEVAPPAQQSDVERDRPHGRSLGARELLSRGRAADRVRAWGAAPASPWGR